MAKHITKDQLKVYRKWSYAKKLRDNPTKAEELMWGYIQRLNNEELPEGCFFRRQSVVYEFIPDFSCEAAKVILEVDGSVHEKQKLKDQYRDEYLMRHGWLVLRVRNEDVYDFAHAEAIAKRLVFLCRSRLNMS